jgi:hypothetical protein
MGIMMPENRTETFIVLTSNKTAPHKRYQPHPAEPNTPNAVTGFFVLLKMGIMMPKTC